MIVDTSALLAYFDRHEPAHERVAEVIDHADEALIISPYVLAELDYLVLSRHGAQAEQLVLRELAGGAWELADMPIPRLRAAISVVQAYQDQPIGLADAANIVLAQDYRTKRIATLDRRHSPVLRFPDGSAPQILPAD